MQESISVTLKRASNHTSTFQNGTWNIAVKVPLRMWHLEFQATHFNYKRQIPRARYSNQDYTGLSYNYHSNLSRTIFRNPQHKTDLGLGITFKNSDNYIANNLISVSSQKLAISSMRLSHLLLTNHGSYTSALGWNHGFKLHSPANHKLKPNFNTYTLDLGFLSSFQVKQLKVATNTQLHYLYSPDTLYSSEQLYLGGKSNIRGFKEASKQGEHGHFIRHEFSTPIGLIPQHPLWGKFNFYTTVDYGKINSSSSKRSGELASSGLGIRNSNANLLFELAFSKPIKPHDARGSVFAKFAIQF